jgi:hypothetical protein
MTDFLLLAFVFLIAGVVAVPIAARLGLGSVLGYLIAGIVISPFLAWLHVDVISIQHFAEFGVVMMLFLVGLELEPKLLWSMRAKLLGLGGGQVLLTTLAVMAIAMGFGLVWSVALAVGLVMALSSTAIVLQTLSEKGLMKSDGGQSTFSVLLFQDIAVIPMLALVPLLALPELTQALSDSTVITDGDHSGASMSLVAGLPNWGAALVTLGAIATVIVAGAITGTAVVTALSGDNVSISGSSTGTFDTKHVDNAKAITISGNSLSGNDAANYTVGQQTDLTADVTAKALNISGLAASEKVYDGTTDAGTIDMTGINLTGLVAGDTVAVETSGTFNTKNVGVNKTITLTSINSGADVGNYTITDQTSLTEVAITPKSLTVSGLTANNKVYDGTRDAGAIDMSGLTFTGLVAGDTVAVATTGTFDTKNAGVDKTITLTSANSGTDAGNYAITDQTTYGLADITTKALTATATVANRTYDGLTTANAILSLSGMVGAETLTITSVDSTFNDKNVANDKIVTINTTNFGSGANGGLASNYSLMTGQTTLANITSKSLTVSGLSASDKVYDGTTDAGTIDMTGLNLSGLVVGDAVDVTTTGTFDTKNAGVDKTITLTSINSGADVGNYTIAGQATYSLTSITTKALSAVANAANKIGRAHV